MNVHYCSLNISFNIYIVQFSLTISDFELKMIYLNRLLSYLSPSFPFSYFKDIVTNRI